MCVSPSPVVFGLWRAGVLPLELCRSSLVRLDEVDDVGFSITDLGRCCGGGIVLLFGGYLAREDAGRRVAIAGRVWAGTGKMVAVENMARLLIKTDFNNALSHVMVSDA